MTDSLNTDQSIKIHGKSNKNLSIIHSLPLSVCPKAYKFCIFQPVFLTKEERAAQALKRRQEQVEEQKKRQEEERKKQMEFLSTGRDSIKGWLFY